MAISEAHKLRRRKYIGASEVPAVLGLDPYRTKYDVYLDKTGKLEESQTSDAAKIGQVFEVGILRLAEEQLGKITLNQWRVLQGTHLSATDDAIVRETGRPVEAKFRGIFKFPGDDWGEKDTDQVPDDVIAQAQTQLLCTGSDLCHVAAFLTGRGFVMFAVPLDKGLGETIIEAVERFWNNHIVKDIPPEESQPSASVIKRIRREPKSIIDIPKELVEILQLRKAASKIATKESKDADTALKAALGVAEAGRFDGGIVTFLRQTRKAYSVPEIVYRVLKIKRDKK